MPKPIVLDPRILADLKEQYDTLSATVSQRFLPLMLDNAYCEDASYFLSTIPDNSVDLLFTDEPYGIESSVIAFRDNTRKPYTSQFTFDAPLPAHLLSPWILEAYRVLKDGGALVNCGIESWSTSFQNVCEWSGLEVRKQGVWIKTNPPTRVRLGGFKSAHERIWVASKGSLRKRMKKVRQAELNNWVIEAQCPNCNVHFPVTWSHNYKLTDSEWADVLWSDDDVFIEPYKAHSHRVGHPNEKPDWLAAWYIWLLTDEGDVVVDCFSGVGTFPLMAARMSRHFIANDYNPEYVEIMNNRITALQASIF